MKLSYTHADKKYSVVTLKDGRVMEIRRGDQTFAGKAAEERKFWDSMDAWAATWPDGVTIASSASSASNSPSSAKQPLSPIIQRYCRGLPYNVTAAGPSSEDLSHYTDRIKMMNARLESFRAHAKRNPDKTFADEIRTALWEIDYYTKKLQTHQKFLSGEYKYPPRFIRKSKIYVSHGGTLLPVYHNINENLVYVRVHDPTAKKGEKTCTPEELGVTADSKFYKRNTYSDMFEPLA